MSTDMSLHCLGDWEGPDGQRFVALMDTRAQARARTARSGILGITGQQQQEPESLDRPRYNCAVSVSTKNVRSYFFVASLLSGHAMCV